MGCKLYQKMLVPLDGSSKSETILGQAKSMVLDYHVPEMILLTVVEQFHEQPYRKDDDWNIKIQKEAVRVARNYLKALQEKLLSEGVDVKTVILEGEPALNILDYAVMNGVDLIMMNAKGKIVNNHWVFGGVTNRIIRHSPVPVLISR
jgi:nucleotide-binding universal stress UspA family protein